MNSRTNWRRVFSRRHRIQVGKVVGQMHSRGRLCHMVEMIGYMQDTTLGRRRDQRERAMQGRERLLGKIFFEQFFQIGVEGFDGG